MGAAPANRPQLTRPPDTRILCGREGLDVPA